ncbi:MAG: tRNA (adenosine(37)-N6)-threonylcarbamoyltransferase complex dimerization subunit type 1 TsaB [Candidatus Bipolaricaulia bacterium]
MLTLGIDTATEIGSVGLSDDSLIGELTFSAKIRQSERLIQAIDRLLELNRVEVEDLNLIVVSAGPGSFTGLRIGMATAKGLAQALKVPLVGVPTMESYARRVAFWSGRVCVLIHDRRNLVYVAEFTAGEQTAAERVEGIERVLGEAEGKLFLGSGAELYRAELTERGGTIAPRTLNLPSGLEIALLGAAEFAAAGEDELFTLEPRYAQRPLAEIRSKERVIDR